MRLGRYVDNRQLFRAADASERNTINRRRYRIGKHKITRVDVEDGGEFTKSKTPFGTPIPNGAYKRRQVPPRY